VPSGRLEGLADFLTREFLRADLRLPSFLSFRRNSEGLLLLTKSNFSGSWFNVGGSLELFASCIRKWDKRHVPQMMIGNTKASPKEVL